MPLVEVSDADVDLYGGATNHGKSTDLVKILPPKMVEAALKELFPAVDPGRKAVGVRVLIQKKKAMGKTRGGIILPDDSNDADQRSTAEGKLISMGSGAFFDSQSGRAIAADYKVNDFVRFPKWGGDEFKRGGVTFVLWNWWDVSGVVTDLNVLVS